MFLLMRKRPSIIKDAPIHHCRDNISPNTTLPNKACGKKEKFKIFQTACYRGGEELVERGFRIEGHWGGWKGFFSTQYANFIKLPEFYWMR